MSPITKGKRCIAYYRVSTQKQGRSGLGLEAQRAAVAAFAQARGLEIIAEHVEVETASGKRRRLEFERAIAAAQDERAGLLFAKLDRLARDPLALEQLRDSRVPFVCCDTPDANDLTLDILLAVARDELRRIKERTRAALAAKKERGEKLGNPATLTDAGRAAGSQVMRERAILQTRTATAYALERRQEGDTLREIAERMNRLGFQTRQGAAYSHRQVKRLLDRVAA